MQYGLIAEEVATTFPELVVYNDIGQPMVRYQELTPVLGGIKCSNCMRRLLRRHCSLPRSVNWKQQAAELKELVVSAEVQAKDERVARR